MSDDAKKPRDANSSDNMIASRRMALKRIAGLGVAAVTPGLLSRCGDEMGYTKTYYSCGSSDSNCYTSTYKSGATGGEDTTYSSNGYSSSGYSSSGYSSSGYSSSGYSSSSYSSSSYSSYRSYSSQYCSGYGSLYYYSYRCYYS